MIAETDQQHTQEVTAMNWTDEDRTLIDTIVGEMREEGAKWTMPPTKLDRARTAVLEGRLTRGDIPGLWHAQGTTKNKEGQIPHYTITDCCTCPDGREHGKTKYCVHMTAAEIDQRYQDAKADQPQWPLFAPPPTIDERLVQPAAEAPGVRQEPSTVPDVGDTTPAPETPLAPAEGPKEASMSETVPAIPSGQEVTPETLQQQRNTIRHMLGTLGYKPTSVEEYQGAVLTLTDLILAPENFAAIIEVLRNVIAARTKPPGPVIPKQHLHEIHGVATIKYIGLLQLAREQGLVSLTEEWVQNLPDLALASATATFSDGRVFKAIGDATEKNAERVKLHWRRMAGTRAKARALRDALGIEAPSDEEME